jgi:hypothetical protein
MTWGKGNCPGLNVLFSEARDRGTVMSTLVLPTCSRIHAPREPIIRKVEGR